MAALRNAVWPEVAAEAAGIGKTTYFTWMAKGADPDAPPEYQEFRARALEAIAEAEQRLTQNLVNIATSGGPSSATATIELLKRRFRDRWGDKVEQNVMVDGGVAVKHEHSWAPDAPFARQVLVILQQAGKLPAEVDLDEPAAEIIAPLALPAPEAGRDGEAVEPDRATGGLPAAR